MTDKKYDIGLIGLAVMGENLALNIADKGFSIAVYNRTVAKVTKFVHQQAAGLPVGGARSMAEFTAMLKRPRAGDFSFRLVLSRFLMFDQG